MLNQNSFDILKQSLIPFRAGQSSIYGADCAGLVVLYYELAGLSLDLDGFPRGVIHPRTFMKCLTELGFRESAEGDIAIFRQNVIAHCGITDGQIIIHQDSISGRTESIEYYDQVVRYERIF